jgi:RHS repeat-associated protein
VPAGDAVLYVELEKAAEVVLEKGLPSLTFYHADHVRSTSAITDAAGRPVEEVAYYPFGKVRNHWRARGRGEKERYLFSQKELDAESGLHYFEARYLAAPLGRFASCDPVVFGDIEGHLAEPQRLNPYSYALNNPLRYEDSTGKNPLFVLILPEVIEAVVAATEFLVNATIATGIVVAGKEMLDRAFAKGDTSVHELSRGNQRVEKVLPRVGDRVYTPPKVKGKTGDYVVPAPQGRGFIDRHGNRWEWAKGGESGPHGGPHWDVQHKDGTHTNVAPNGNVIGTDNFPNKRK